MNYTYILETKFCQSKYLKYYLSIINNALSEDRNKGGDVYYEYHHILPASVFPIYKNLKEHPWNRATLTAREHFICHYLLCKIATKGSYEWNKFSRAFTFMWAENKNNQTRYFNSKLYSLARENIGVIMSEAQSGTKNSQFGTVWVSNPSTKTTIRINNDDLGEYLEKGYIKKRIVNWDKYLSPKTHKPKNQNKKEYNRIVKHNNKIYNKILQLEANINELKLNILPIPNMELLEGLEPPTS